MQVNLETATTITRQIWGVKKS